MIIKTAEYIDSYVDWQKCPETEMPEYAFIGRSNVGKSSLINMLTGRNKLALVSVTPGKTQCINYFTINDEWNLVDLPGYGYAKTSKKNRAKWLTMIKKYMKNRENLVNVFQLIDSKVPPQAIDIEFINWMGENEIPFTIVYTKFDKPKKSEHNIKSFEDKMLLDWECMPLNFATSSRSNKGRDEILAYITEINSTIK
ncbi:MAG: ribosome biogenesis GTP-binding protein YihA/YsxC [Chitinophagales bacterium]